MTMLRREGSLSNTAHREDLDPPAQSCAASPQGRARPIYPNLTYIVFGRLVLRLSGWMPQRTSIRDPDAREGRFAEQIDGLFKLIARKHGPDCPQPALSTKSFRRPGGTQLDFFIE